MNIFVLDEDPYKAAEYMCDKHIVKMIVETCQMLASHTYLQLGINSKKDYIELMPVLEEKFSTFPRKDENGNTKLYGVGFLYHPCTRWLSESQANALWLLRHLKGLLKQYTLRYHKTHSCEKIFYWFADLLVETTHEIHTPFPQAMPKQYRHESPVVAYRTFYLYEKRKFCTWKTKKPEWFSNGEILLASGLDLQLVKYRLFTEKDR